MKPEEIPETVAEERTGIDRAFEVLRNHTVHTKGYVMTALKFIQEYGNDNDKIVLDGLLKEKNEQISPTTSKPPAKKRKSGKAAE